MYRNISHLPLYFLKSSFQFSCCTIFSIVPLILWVLCGSSCTWNCMELVRSSVRKRFLGDRCVNCSYVSLHREDNLLRPQGAICQLWTGLALPALAAVARSRSAGCLQRCSPRAWGRRWAQQGLGGQS